MVRAAPARPRARPAALTPGCLARTIPCWPHARPGARSPDPDCSTGFPAAARKSAMISRYVIDGKAITEAGDRQAQVLAYLAPDEREKASLAETLRLDEYDLAS